MEPIGSTGGFTFRQCADSFLDMVSRQQVAKRSKQIQSQFADESLSLRIPWELHQMW